VQSTKVVNSFALNIYDLLYHEQLIISEAAVKELEQLLGPNKEAVAAPAAEEKVEAAAAVDAEPAKPKRARKPAAKPTGAKSTAKATKAKPKGKEATE
jgi:hypothetical protein